MNHRPGPYPRPPPRGWPSDVLDGGPRRSGGPVYRRDTQPRPPYVIRPAGERVQEAADPLATISETLGALNTVGSYIVNVTRGMENSSYPPKELPSALYTISKNILGRNVTDSIAPLVRGVALPLRPPATPPPPPATKQPPAAAATANAAPAEISDRDKETSVSVCTTAEGTAGKCQDLSNCPQLLLDLTKLRQSLCFKSLFVPGVCCPNDKNGQTGTG